MKDLKFNFYISRPACSPLCLLPLGVVNQRTGEGDHSAASSQYGGLNISRSLADNRSIVCAQISPTGCASGVVEFVEKLCLIGVNCLMNGRIINKAVWYRLAVVWSIVVVRQAVVLSGSQGEES